MTTDTHCRKFQNHHLNRWTSEGNFQTLLRGRNGTEEDWVTHILLFWNFYASLQKVTLLSFFLSFFLAISEYMVGIDVHVDGSELKISSF